MYGSLDILKVQERKIKNKNVCIEYVSVCVIIWVCEVRNVVCVGCG